MTTVWNGVPLLVDDESVIALQFGPTATPMLNGDSTAPMSFVQWADKSIQVAGTFGSGGNVVIEGSNDGTNYSTLTNPQGASLATITSAGIFQVVEITRFTRARITAGDGTTAITITVVGHLTTSRRV